ncbi:hypothetical protein J2S78_001355 [Salibacterium salarium]|nr:hypothetical protein [Salibacterium salarium]
MWKAIRNMWNNFFKRDKRPITIEEGEGDSETELNNRNEI